MGAYMGAIVLYVGLSIASCTGNDRLDRIAIAVEKIPQSCPQVKP